VCSPDEIQKNKKILAHPALDFQLTIKTLSRIRRFCSFLLVQSAAMTRRGSKASVVSTLRPV
jgi:hypothetical protein